MTKTIHTRAKRKLKLSTKFQHKAFVKGIERKVRPRTFPTEESANKWATEQGIKGYTLKKVKKDKRFQIVKNKE